MRPTQNIILALALTQFSLASAFANEEAKTYFTRDYGVKHAKGYVKSKKANAFAAVKRTSFVGDPASVPVTYSVRGKAGPVEDQGQCGSCWDFSLTTVLRGTWIMQGNDPGRLSFNYLLNCVKSTDYAQGCNGGDFGAATAFVTPKGAPAYGSDGTYTQADGTCKKAAAVASTVDYKLLGDETDTTGAKGASFQDIAYVVGVLHRPVSVVVAADDTWENYSGGTFNGCSDQKVADIDHMVVIEGYSCEKSVDSKGNCVFDANGNLPAGVGTWVVRNSWGTSWGDNGYITMKATNKAGARCNEIGIYGLYYDVKAAN